MPRSPKNDPQVQSAYSWENSFTHQSRKLTENQMYSVIARVLKLYQVPMVQLRCIKRDKRNGKVLSSEYDANDHLIRIVPRHMTIDVALHEAAHTVIDWILGWNVEPHGAHWLSVYMTLLDRFKVMPLTGSTAMAKERGLKWTPLWRVAPKRIRRVHPAMVRLARMNHPEELIACLAG